MNMRYRLAPSWLGITPDTINLPHSAKMLLMGGTEGDVETPVRTISSQPIASKTISRTPTSRVRHSLAILILPPPPCGSLGTAGVGIAETPASRESADGLAGRAVRCACPAPRCAATCAAQ